MEQHSWICTNESCDLTQHQNCFHTAGDLSDQPGSNSYLPARQKKTSEKKMQRLGFALIQPSCLHTWVVDVLLKLKHWVFVFCVIVSSIITIVTTARISKLKSEVTQ